MAGLHGPVGLGYCGLLRYGVVAGRGAPHHHPPLVPLIIMQGIYILQRGDFHKIGITGNLSNRVSAIRNANPDPVRILCWQGFNMDAIDEFGDERWAKVLEQRWHDDLAEYRHHHEWFKLPPKTLAAVMSCFVEEEYPLGYAGEHPHRAGEERFSSDGDALEEVERLAREKST